MLFLLLFLSVESSENISDYKFSSYVQDYSFSWDVGSNDWKMHRNSFDKELANIVSHNLNQSKLWKKGLNKFTAAILSERKAFTGRFKSHHFLPKSKYRSDFASGFVMKPINQLPVEIDWRKHHIVSPVKDQGDCGSCWAFASTAVIESAVAKNSGLLFELSVQQVEKNKNLIYSIRLCN